MENDLLKYIEEHKDEIEKIKNAFFSEEKKKREEKMKELIEIFDYEQYKKDIDQLNELINRIVKNNPSCITGLKRDRWDGSITQWVPIERIDGDKQPKEQPKVITDVNETMKHVKKKIPTEQIKTFGDGWVGKELSSDIIEKSKEKIENDLPSVARDLEKLGLYGCYAVSDNKFNAAYLDFVELVENNSETVLRKETDSSFITLEKEIPAKTLEVRLFNFVGRMNERFISLENKDIDVGIKDFINDEFVKKVKELADKNIEDEIKIKALKEPIDIKEMDKNTLTYRINAVSNYINVKNRRGGATFILSSSKNIDAILKTVSGWKSGRKIFKYNKSYSNLDLVVNNDLGDTVIIGRKPQEGEPGINFVVNRNTLTNFTYSEEDVSGINLSFDFFVFGQHPEYNYFSFEMKR
jgi:hypothetical protein